LKWHTFFAGINVGDEQPLSLALTLDGGAVLSGQSNVSWGNPIHTHQGNYDALIIRLGADPIPTTTPRASPQLLYLPSLIKDYPQPKECATPGLDCGEPNEQASQAYGPLEIGRTYYATVGGTDDAKDLYHLNLQGGSTYEVFLNFDPFNNPSNADLDIVLRRNQPPDYPLVKFSSNQAQRFERFTFNAPATGSYIVLIDSAVPNVRTVYTLQVQQAALAD